jgi:hypothetical protein
MRRLAILLTLALVATALGVGVSTAAKPTVVRAGGLVLRLNGGVTPKRLPARRMAPIALNVSAGIASIDGSHPPAARTVTIDFDKNGTINARGLAACRSGQLQARTTAAARAACRNAIVGSGRTKVEVEFAEQAPFTTSGPLVLFNGGVRGGKTTMFIHAYVNVPAPTAIVTTVVVKRRRSGRFGTRAVARIPSIAGGSGSVTSFSLNIERRFNHRGQRRSYLSARCATGRFFARGDIAFRGGPRIKGTVVRPCRRR